MDRNGFEEFRSIPLVKRVSRSFKMEDVGSLLLVLELVDDFDDDINDGCPSEWVLKRTKAAP